MIQEKQRAFSAIGKSEQRGGDLRRLPGCKEGDIFQLQRRSLSEGGRTFLGKLE